MKSRFKKAIIWFCVNLFFYLLAFLYVTEWNYTLDSFCFSIVYFLIQILIGIIVPLIWFLCRKRKMFSHDKGVTICIVNSCIIHGLSWLITIILEFESFVGIGWFTAICILFINYHLFVVDEENKTEDVNELQPDVEIDKKNVEENEAIDIIDESKNGEKDQDIEKIDIVEENKHCTKCGKEIDLSWDYCYYCGNKLK